MSAAPTDVLDLFTHNELIAVARKINQCLDRKHKTSARDADFKSIIETECNADVFPITKAVALSCQCELSEMTHGEVLSIKLANLDEIRTLIAQVKWAMGSIKMMKIGEALVSVVPKPADTQTARILMKDIEEDIDTMVSTLKQSAKILNNWFDFLDHFKLEEAPVIREDEEPLESKNKRAKKSDDGH